MIFQALPHEGTGCIAYLVGCQRAGIAAIIDAAVPDVEECVALARAKGLQITHALDTHVHADHVSGSRALAEVVGASCGLHEAADVRYPHTSLHDDQRIRLGTVELRVLHTPGHTPESMCLVVTDLSRGEEPWFVLTGDTLFVGDVGRPDFGGEQAAAQLHRSLFQRLLPLGDSVEVYPAHGAGSMCGRAMSAKVGSTIGFERRFNHALRHREPGAFVHALMTGVPPKPASMDRIIARNRGTVAVGHPSSARLAPGDLEGATVVDAREPHAFGAGHRPGSLNAWLDGGQFAERVAMLAPAGRPLALVVETEADAGRAVSELARAGLDEVRGHLLARDLPTAGLARMEGIEPRALAERLATAPGLAVLDVREPGEWREGHVKGARHLPVRDVAAHLAEIPRGAPLAVVCGGGARSALVVSFLQAHGFTGLLNVWGGMSAWTGAGLPVTRD